MLSLFLAQGFFDEVFSSTTDTAVYFPMGAVGSVLFLLKMILMMAFGLDADMDFDVDADGDGAFDAHGTDFSLFSILSILSFLMGAGWMGFACRWEWQMGAVVSAMCASAFGFGLMLFSSLGMWQMKKMNEVGRYDVRNTVGRIGRVYLKIPARGQGRGQIQIDVDGRHKVVSAISTGPEIASYAAVKVMDVQEGETVIVEPVD